MNDFVTETNFLVGICFILFSIMLLIVGIRDLKKGKSYIGDFSLGIWFKVSKSDNKKQYRFSIISEFIVSLLFFIGGIIFIVVL